MTYPQPRTSDGVQAGQNFFRFNTLVNGPGEIYEIDTACTALTMGPDCDFQQLQISYFDQTRQPSLLNTVRVTPTSPFAGPLAPRPEQPYPASGPNTDPRKGRLLVTLGDIMTPIPTAARADDGWRPTGFNGAAGEAIYFVPPVIDLIGWYQIPPPVPTRRGDKTYSFQNLPQVAVGQNFWTVLPVYGRKYMFVDFFNHSGGAITLTILGVNYATAINTTLAVAAQVQKQTTIFAAAAVADNAGQKQIITSTANGMFDALAISLNGGVLSNFQLRVDVSDTI